MRQLNMIITLCIINVLIVSCLSNCSNRIATNDTNLHNFSQLCFAAKYDNFVYYANVEDGSCLYEYDQNTDKKTKLTDVAASMLQIYGKKLYYLDTHNESLMFMDLSTRKSERYIRTTALAYFIRDESLYLLLQGKLAIVDPKTNEITYIVEDFTPFPAMVCLTDEWIYYINDASHKLFKAKYDGSEQILLAQNANVSPAVLGKYVYYTGVDKNAYRVASDGGEPEVFENATKIFVSYNDYLYYQMSVEDKEYVYRTDGSDAGAMITDDNAIMMNIVGNQAYYLTADETGILKLHTVDIAN